jgi:hypothetical protein
MSRRPNLWVEETQSSVATGPTDFPNLWVQGPIRSRSYLLSLLLRLVLRMLDSYTYAAAGQVTR